MAYTINQLKVLAYNLEDKPDFSIPERNLFYALAYAYEWYRAEPEAEVECKKLMNENIAIFENSQKGSV